MVLSLNVKFKEVDYNKFSVSMTVLGRGSNTEVYRGMYLFFHELNWIFFNEGTINFLWEEFQTFIGG